MNVPVAGELPPAGSGRRFPRPSPVRVDLLSTTQTVRR